MAHKIVEDGVFNLSDLEYGPLLARIDPRDYSLKSTMPTDYTIIPGDDLGTIAHTYGLSADDLFRMNSGTLDRAAKIHGHNDSDSGRLLYPGTTIKV